MPPSPSSPHGISTPSTVFSSLISTTHENDSDVAEDLQMWTPDANIVSIGLQLPPSSISDNKRVVLLCTQVAPRHNEDMIYIDEKQITSDLQVTKILFETPASVPPNTKRVIIFQCKLEDRMVCLKLINDNEIYQSEKRAYETMVQHGGRGAAQLFLKVHFFCEVMMPDNCVWKGFCMDEGKYSLRDIIYSQTSPTPSLLLTSSRSDQENEQGQILKDILRDKKRALSLSSSKELPDDGGEPVIFQQTQSIQMSVAVAALRLLHRLHVECGWVHGDSHLGNFMYLNQRIYAIDFERSFSSRDPVQHLMDIQEFFGHFSGILLHSVRFNDWDMRDIMGLYYYRHPLTKSIEAQPLTKQQKMDLHWKDKSSNFSRRKCLFMLPICTCFTCPTTDMRLKGCRFCKSEPNLKSADFVAEHFEEMMEDMCEWGLSKMKAGLQYTRQTIVMKQCCSIAELIYPCIKDGSILTMKMNNEGVFVAGKKRGKRLLVEIDEKTSLLNSKLLSELTQSKQGCVSVLKRLLYMPIVDVKADGIVKEIARRLHAAGFTDIADTLLANVAPSCCN